MAFDVLDIDGLPGVESLTNHLEARYIHDGPLSKTGKGWHLLFAITGARNGANLLPKVDFRGRNGYIVAPPSLHPAGHHYEWDPSRGPDTTLPEPPAWLMDLVMPPAPPVIYRAPTDPTLARARDSLDLLDELGKLGVTFVQRGSRLHGRCPFHADDTPSLVVYNLDNFYCYGCDAWGDALNVRNYRTKGALR